MSQLYRRMEEDVARKVRETMELADARRKALRSKEKNKLEQTEDAPQIPPRKPREARDQQLKHSGGSIEASVRIIEDIASELTENKDNDVLKTDKAVTAEQSFLAKDIGNVADENKDLAEEGTNTRFHIGFEHIRDNVDKKHISNAEQTTELPVSYLSDDNREFAMGALTLAQTAAKDIDHRLYSIGDKRQFAEGALNLAQSAAWNIDNRLHETHNTNRRHLADGALNLAQNAARNIDHKLYESDEAARGQLPEVKLNMSLAEEALSLAQNAVRNKPGQQDTPEALAKGALNLAQNAAWDIDNRPEADDDRRRCAEGALSLAQSAAWNIDNEVDKRGIAEGALRLAQNAVRDLDAVQTTNINRRELAEGELNIAQQAAKNISHRPEERQLSRDVGSLEDGSFESITDPENEQNKKLQLGFDHFAALHEEIRSDVELGEVLDQLNKRTLAEHDKKIAEAAEALQILEIDIDNNDYNATEVDDSTKEQAEGALSLAQRGAKRIRGEIYKTNGTNIRELGEGALGLAQTAARKQLSKEASERSLEDDFFKQRTNENRTLQLGFEQIENAFDSNLQETEGADDQVQRPLYFHDSKTRALKEDLEDGGTD